MTNPSLILNLASLADVLRPGRDELRHLDGDILTIEGALGAIHADLTAHIALNRLTPQARHAAQELLDAGAFSADVHGRLSVARVPMRGESQLFRQCLGLDRRRDE